MKTANGSSVSGIWKAILANGVMAAAEMKTMKYVTEVTENDVTNRSREAS